MTVVIGTGSVVTYLVCALLVGKQLTKDQGYRVVASLAFLALTLHSTVLYQDIVTEHGLNLGFFNAASLTTWVVAVLLSITTLARPVLTLGIFVWPLAAVGVLSTMIFTHQTQAVDATIGVQTHVVVSIIAYGVLTIAACQAVALAIQDRSLRKHQSHPFVDVLPPLKTQERILFQLLSVGFFLLSMSLISGMMFVEDMFAQHLTHKTFLAFIAWLVFGVLLWGRWHSGWRGRTAIRWSLSGFALLLLAYFGAKLVLEVILGRVWTS